MGHGIRNTGFRKKSFRIGTVPGCVRCLEELGSVILHKPSSRGKIEIDRLWRAKAIAGDFAGQDEDSFALTVRFPDAKREEAVGNNLMGAAQGVKNSPGPSGRVRFRMRDNVDDDRANAGIVSEVGEGGRIRNRAIQVEVVPNPIGTKKAGNRTTGHNKFLERALPYDLCPMLGQICHCNGKFRFPAVFNALIGEKSLQIAGDVFSSEKTGKSSQIKQHP